MCLRIIACQYLSHSLAHFTLIHNLLKPGPRQLEEELLSVNLLLVESGSYVVNLRLRDPFLHTYLFEPVIQISFLSTLFDR